MNESPTENRSLNELRSESPMLPAGVWLRLVSFLIDLLVVCVPVEAAKLLLLKADLYIPLELTILISLGLYFVILTGWRGQTLGKIVCGLWVRPLHRHGAKVGFGRTFVREVLGKTVSSAVLGVGFLWIGISKQKRGWQDYLAGTVVLQELAAVKRARLVCVVMLGMVALFLGVWLAELIGYVVIAQQVTPPATARERWAGRSSASLVEVTNVTNNQLYVRWLDQTGLSPVDYAVLVVRRHQVTIFGELHEKQQSLDFLNRAIPELYHRAGVTCVAMEVCLAKDNAKLWQLVTGAEFDRGLALQIARRQPFGVWGFKGYWDVLETVWCLNKTLPPGQRKMRVNGLDSPMDMPSIAMLGLESEISKDCPLWERLRAIRLIQSLPRVLIRDSLFVRQVEREMLQRGERGIIWIGAAHSPLNSRQALPAQKAMPRMGFMLYQKYGDKIGQIRIHSADIPASYLDSTYHDRPAMADFVEQVMAQRAHRPVGFDVIGSPFDLLRDQGSMEFHFQPRLGLGDIASGYIYLDRAQNLKGCAWLPGYISQEMFVANKPFYQAFGKKAGQNLQSAAECNAFWSRME